jgi:predicted outer membrane repeat protein
VFTSYEVGVGTACGQSASFANQVICWGQRAQIIGLLSPACSSSRRISMSATNGIDASWCGTTGFQSCRSLSFILSASELSRPFSIIEPSSGRYYEGGGLLDRGAVRLVSVGQSIQLPVALRNGNNEAIFDCQGGTCLLISHWSIRLEYITFTGGAPAVEVDFDLRKLLLTNVTFRGNNGVSSSLEGAAGLYVRAGTTLTCKSCRFTNNIAAGDGAGLTATFATIQLQSCYFDSNRASVSGGAIFAYSSTLFITSTLFSVLVDSHIIAHPPLSSQPFAFK